MALNRLGGLMKNQSYALNKYTVSAMAKNLAICDACRRSRMLRYIGTSSVLFGLQYKGLISTIYSTNKWRQKLKKYSFLFQSLTKTKNSKNSKHLKTSSHYFILVII